LHIDVTINDPKAYTRPFTVRVEQTIVADGSDNFATRYLVSDACYLAKKPLVFAAVGPFEGYITTLKPHETAADGTPFPSYRCLFPEAPPPGTVALPANTSEEELLRIVDRLNAELHKVVRMREVQERFDASGIETLLNTPEEFRTMLESETLRWGKVVKAAGIKPE